MSEAAPKSKKKMLMFVGIGVLTLVLLVGGGLTAYFLLKSGGSDDDAGHDTKTEAKKDKPKKKKDEKKLAPVFERLALFTANLDAPETGEVLQTDVTVELANEKERELLKQYLPKIQGEVNKLLRAKKPAEVKTVSGMDKLGVEIKETINKILKTDGESEGVLSVQFTTFIVR